MHFLPLWTRTILSVRGKHNEFSAYSCIILVDTLISTFFRSAWSRHNSSFSFTELEDPKQTAWKVEWVTQQ